MSNAHDLANALEINEQDINLILDLHGVDLTGSQEIVNQIFADDELCGKILKGISYFDNSEAQTISAYSDIEDWMLERGHLPQTSKQYTNEMAQQYEDC